MNTCPVAAEDFEMPEVDGYHGGPFVPKFGVGGLSLMEVEESPEVASLIGVSFIKYCRRHNGPRNWQRWTPLIFGSSGWIWASAKRTLCLALLF